MGGEGISNGSLADSRWSYETPSYSDVDHDKYSMPPVAVEAGASSSMRSLATDREELGRLAQVGQMPMDKLQTMGESKNAELDEATLARGRGGRSGGSAYGRAMMGAYGGAMSTEGATANAPVADGRHDIQVAGGTSLGGAPITEELPEANRGPGGPVVANESDLLSWKAGRERATRDESAVNRENSRLGGAMPAGTPAQPEGISSYGGIVTYDWSGTLRPKKPLTPAAPPMTDSVASSDKKESDVSELRDRNAVDGDRRVPVLGDQPIVGSFFRRATPETEMEVSKGLQELRETAEAAPAYGDEITYPKNWSELSARQKADAQAGIDNVRTPDVEAERLRKLVEQTKDEADAAPSPSPAHFQMVPVNPWVMTERDALSTFALDVDTASYAVCRQYIRNGTLPPVGAVRMEEFVNAFEYAYPQRDDATFAVYAEGAPSPFAPAGQDVTLLKIAVKARTVGRDRRRAAHIVFVVDASASMGQADRLPQVQSALNLLVDKLAETDRVSLITCAGEARLHLQAVSAQQRDTIRQTVEAIQPAGPTNLMAGLQLGYAIARRAFVAGQINQVVLCSDGVANVGQTEAQAVLDEVAEDRKQGITLTCVGVGYGAYNDAFLEALADRGDGRYVFLDSSEGAQDTLVGQLAATLETVARDARIQVQFDPARVRRYRLIGYENRDIEDQRFRDDTIDAGEVGSGQCSTALYELELTAPAATDGSDDLGTVFVRYRNAETGQIEEFSRVLAGSIVRRRSVEDDPRFFLAAGAARFAEWLRGSEHARRTTLSEIQRLLDGVSVALPLDQNVRDLAALAHQAEGLPRAPQP
jgi:Ca-activated chloride channel family protein